MSKIKNPQEKKKKSYQKDCRNDYGENDKGSRKNIRKGKQRSSKLFRSASTKLKSLTKYSVDEDLALEMENEIESTEKIKRLKGFKKVPDRPLRYYLESKRKSK